ncbi:glutathione s-transferase t3 [Quercus suber]|uniref:Glutathione s-transferase t3 n=1 Tax=Quercus suber TaxID=58331 RepID=A0AAW0J8Y4_QUESU
MDSRQYSSFTDVLRGNINGEDELFGLSENSPLLVQDSPLDDEVATSKKKSARGVAFNHEEDKLLVAAWLNTSVDPVHGNEQHKTTFYGKVAKYFKDHKTDSTRSISSLTSRWGMINRETVKFCGALAKVEAKNESGTTAEMKIKKARELFKELYGTHFLYEHCWLMLKDFPKWASTMPREDSSKEMPQTPDSIDQGGGVGDTMDFERPIGRKAEKANRKRKDDGKDVAAEYLKKKMKMLEESYAQEKERVRIKAEKVRLKELKENERIMMLDTSGMNEDQRTFYDGLKKEILAKQRSSCSLG